MAVFANWLSMISGRPVIDRTGLTSTYAFELNWTPELNAIGRMKVEASGFPMPDPNGPDLFTALQEQLGLRLEPGKGPVETLVVERVERPAAN